MWFRTDLRVSDNPALHAAAHQADRGVVAVYTICPKQWQAHDMAPIKVDFILRNLRELSATLKNKNIALTIIETATFDGVSRSLRGLARALDCDALFFNREYEVNERRRDEAVTDAFEAAGAEVHTFTDQCLFEPGTLRTGKDGFYTVYSPFKRAWYRAFDANRDRGEPLTTPRKQREMVGQPSEIPARVDGFDLDCAHSNLWNAGEKTARGKLAAFIRLRIAAYQDDRDLPASDGTSTLSPYLASGVVSLRQCVQAALEANNGRLATGSTGVAQWISELIWREFYKHILVGFPCVCMHRAFQPATDRLEWNDNDEHFDLWCQGRTGYPIVDAAMRQLSQTGWMHNRLRMIVAMFLSKNLFLDWRRGEKFFMEHLVDGDLSANNGGWQWAASTGTDAAPYFRIFNPVSQSKKCDPDGAFIRRFVPELSNVAAPEIHDPSTIPARLHERRVYPEPIVDHSATRAQAIEAFKALRT
jgi:deoxyribodipyrimidine photo-lyase